MQVPGLSWTLPRAPKTCGVEGLCKVEVNPVNSFAGVHQTFRPFLNNKEVGEVAAVWHETVLRRR